MSQFPRPKYHEGGALQFTPYPIYILCMSSLDIYMDVEM